AYTHAGESESDPSYPELTPEEYSPSEPEIKRPPSESETLTLTESNAVYSPSGMSNSAADDSESDPSYPECETESLCPMWMPEVFSTPRYGDYVVKYYGYTTRIIYL
ncbi:hypothetical protein KIPB_015739, partial [Kipferlia bialata]